jgi:2-iminobutanoate/2-iminopropanoate deaminase
MLSLTAAGLIGLATSVSFGIANAQDTGKNVISTLNAPKPLGPYSQAIRISKTIYFTGQLATDPKTNLAMANASIEDQTRLVLENLKGVLTADELTMHSMVSTTVFLKDMNEFTKINDVYE